MIPVVSIAIKKLGDKLFLLLYGIVLISGMIVPNINTVLAAAGSSRSIDFGLSSADVFSLYFLYVIVGYWISQGKLKKIKKIWIYSGFVTGILGTTLFQFWIYFTPSNYHVRYADVGILVSAALLFEIIRREAIHFQHAEKGITYLSKISFGIYFVHICVMGAVNTLMKAMTPLQAFPFQKFVLLECSVFIFSVMLIWITSKSK